MTDLEGRAFRRVGCTLVAVDFAAQEMLDSISEGKEVLITIRQPRSPEFHRRFFAILRRVVETSDVYQDEEELLSCLKICVGHTKPVQLPNGEVYRLPRSINFASLGQDAFQRFVKRSLYVLGKMIGVDPESLLKEATETQPPAQKKQKATSKQPVR
jgi:hypothetical protein